MPVSKAQQKAVHKYVKSNYDRMELTVPKGRKEAIKAQAEAQGQSVNGYINAAIDARMTRGSGTAPETAGKRPESATGAGVVSLPSDALKAAQEAAGRTGEAVVDFVARAVAEQKKRDDRSFKMGINPV